MSSEAGIHFEFYRHLANAIEDEPSRNGITFGDIEPEYGEGMSGFADIVLFDDSGSPVLVIEAKAPNGRSRREIDPYSTQVIEQAFGYAGNLGAPHFATFNGNRLVVFDAYEEGVPLLQRSTKSYTIGDLSAFADTFLDEISRIRRGETQWDATDEAFIERVRSIHEQVAPELEDELGEKLEDDDEFSREFIDWTDSQGIDYGDADEGDREQLQSEFADQAAYLLVNKIIFYKLLEDSETYGGEIEPLAVSPFRVQEDLEEYFDHLVEEVDFEAIYEHDEIYSEIPLDTVADRVRDFIIELDDQNLSQFDSDVIGRIYEGVIPPERRKEMGEYYTPPAICDLICRLTIDESDDDVLDPACGSGGFLVSAYHRKKELNGHIGHQEILEQLYGVDINRFPAHLTAINLAIQDLSSYTDQVNIEISDFFDIRPDTQRFRRERASAGGGEQEEGSGGEIGGFDAIVANPPYVRGRNIDNDKKDDIRNHLSRVDAGGLSRRMDLYGYFLTHSAEFLEDGGQLGFIVNDTWLETGYGTDLQEFMLDNFCVDAVIKLDKQAFDDALVGSSIILLKKEEDEQVRRENVTKFVRIRGSIDIDDVEEVVKEDMDSDYMMRDEYFRVVTRKQEILREEEKWTVFLRAPPVYYDIYGSDDTVELQEVADVDRGLTTGANAWFYKRMDEWRDLGLEEYTTPLLKASGQVDKIRFTEEDAEEWGVMDLHDTVQPALEETQEIYEDVDEEEYVKGWLADNGHETLVEYIRVGESEENEYHERPTMNPRTLWFDLGDLTYPPMFIPDFTWRIHRVVWSEVDAVSDRQFYHIEPYEGIGDELLCAILNSRIVWLMCELRGRWSQGAAMSRSEIKVYEAEELPVPDPREISDEQEEGIKEAFWALVDAEEELDPDDRTVENTEDERDRLDEAILDAFDVTDVQTLKDAIGYMIALREKEGGERQEILVNRPEEREVIELDGVQSSRESTTLSDF